jgi:hypothetical protein
MKIPRHRFNIFPGMSAEEKAELRESLERKGWIGEPVPIVADPAAAGGSSLPDGVQRQDVTTELGIDMPIKELLGKSGGTPTDEEIMDFVIASNTRRNLNPSQKALQASRLATLSQGKGARVRI